MVTTKSGSKLPSPAKKISKISKKPPTNSSKVDPKMSLKRIAKKGMSDVAEPSGSKKRPIPNKIESRKTKRAKSSKSAKDFISYFDFEDEVHDGEVKPKVKSKVHAKSSEKYEDFDLPKKKILLRCLFLCFFIVHSCFSFFYCFMSFVSDDNHFCVVDFFFFILVVFKLLYHFCSHKLCVVKIFIYSCSFFCVIFWLLDGCL
ncbi:hypothetical protein CsatA_025431 [Cannabis sativa]